MKAEL